MPNPFSFAGRLGRLAYFGYSTLYSVVSGFTVLLLLFSLPRPGSTSGQSPSTIGLMILVVVVSFLLTNMSSSVRRLHDLNRTGWWYLLIIVPGPNVVLALMLLLAPGTTGPNRYGSR